MNRNEAVETRKMVQVALATRLADLGADASARGMNLLPSVTVSSVLHGYDMRTNYRVEVSCQGPAPMQRFYSRRSKWNEAALADVEQKLREYLAMASVEAARQKSNDDARREAREAIDGIQVGGVRFAPHPGRRYVHMVADSDHGAPQVIMTLSLNLDAFSAAFDDIVEDLKFHDLLIPAVTADDHNAALAEMVEIHREALAEMGYVMGEMDPQRNLQSAEWALYRYELCTRQQISDRSVEIRMERYRETGE